MDVTCYIRVFDLAKYREIQPIVSSIYSRNANPDLVASLIIEAIGKIETDEFIQYHRHHEWIQEGYSDNLQSALKLVQSGRLSEWYIEDPSGEEVDNDNLEQDEYDPENSLLKQQILSFVEDDEISSEDDWSFIQQSMTFDENYPPIEQECHNLPEDEGWANKETIEIVIMVLCYPKYQESIDDELNLVSDNIAEYSNIYGYWYGFNKFFHDLVNDELPEHPAEYVLLADGRFLSIVEPNLLPYITKIVREDLANLSRSDWILYSIETHWYDELSEFEKAEEKRYALIDRQIQTGTVIFQDLEFYYGMRDFAMLLAESRRHKVSNQRYSMFPKISPPENLDDGDVAIAVPEIQDELIAFYQRLTNILELVNSQSGYTISNEKYIS